VLQSQDNNLQKKVKKKKTTFKTGLTKTRLKTARNSPYLKVAMWTWGQSALRNRGETKKDVVKGGGECEEGARTGSTGQNPTKKIGERSACGDDLESC